jgi:SNF family Na+-dependent transporter
VRGVNHIFADRAQPDLTAPKQGSAGTIRGNEGAGQTSPSTLEQVKPEGAAMSQKLFALSLGFAALILATQHASAQSTTTACGTRAAIVTQLAAKYGETRRGIGIANNNSVMEVFASDQTGSWTITVTVASGQTCMLASGQSFEGLADALPASGKGA